jgi:hypothetical protein
MSEQNYEPGDDGDEDTPDPDDVIDIDTAFGDDVEDQDFLTSGGYSPPEKPRGLDRFGTTVDEQREGESLEARLAQEVPDPNLDEGDPLADDGDADDEDNYDVVDENTVDPEDLRYSEVGGERAGRLVAPDEGLEEDREKDLVGDDVGIDGAAASAEEAAVHIIPD